jgi:anti-sigma regulatory factor (Ser/Thr protein kinase)
VPLWQTERDFPGDALSPGSARNFCTERLTGLFGRSDSAHEAIAVSELIVSELVTNAVNASSARLSVRLTVDDERLRIGVRDDVGGEPKPRTAAPTDQAGRGLAVVVALSTAWGVIPNHKGKLVWAELVLPGALTGHATQAARSREDIGADAAL